MTKRPRLSVFASPLLCDAQQAQLLETQRKSTLALPEFDVDELISQQAQVCSDKIAVRFVDKSFTYAELERESNRLSHILQAQGIGPGKLVGISQRRSIAMLVSVLAVMKAGGAYVPLDPSYPRERLTYMLEDADLQLLLTDQAVIDAGILADVISHQNAPCSILNIDRLEPVSDVCNALPENLAIGSDLAYVIYTSGSTGKPKGVEITRENLSNFILGMQIRLEIGQDDHLLAVTSLSFDIAALELYLPLVCGASLTIGDETLVMDGLRLSESLSVDHGVTMMQATPATWKLLLSTDWKHHDQGRFTALCGGEAFPTALANELLRQPLTVWNLYGPTETTVWSSAFKLNENSDLIKQSVPIGTPIANTQLYVLDEHKNPLPQGAVGELFIGGAGLARGYLGKRELSLERFVDSAFGRLYRTGDLACYRRDGTLECLGRIDNQVKLRGYRVELGEIESILHEQDHIQDAAVNVTKFNGEDLLVAYIQLINDEAQADIIEAELLGGLNSILAAKLPAYMRPAEIVHLDSLPLTPNGKVDRKALPKPKFSRQTDKYVAPETATERALCEIWQEVLSVDRVGLNDNFFVLGGHSLLATQLLVKVNDHFKIDLALKALFGLNTLSELAAAVDQKQPQLSDDSFALMDDLLAELERSDELQV